MSSTEVTPDEIVDFWFPDGPAPEPEAHMKLWAWRMRGGANDAILKKYTEVTRRAAEGAFDHWAATPRGRMALIILLDQFSRTVWAGTPQAFAQDGKAAALCLGGLANGHFGALGNVWMKSAFKIPLEHCECPGHMANLDLAVSIADRLIDEAPENLREVYRMAAEQPRRHRAVIERFGRHAHRNDVLGRTSTPEERDYIATGDFPHLRKIG